MNTLQLLKEKLQRAQRQQQVRNRIAPMSRPLSYHTTAHQSPSRLNAAKRTVRTLSYRGIPYDTIRSNWL